MNTEIKSGGQNQTNKQKDHEKGRHREEEEV